MGNILVVDDKESMRDMVAMALVEAGHVVVKSESAESAMTALSGQSFDVVVSDLRMTGLTGIDLLKFVKMESPATEVLIITAYGSVADAVEAMKHGASDFIEKPFELSTLEARVQKAVERSRLAQENELLRDELKDRTGRLVGTGVISKQINELIEKVASAPTPVLVTGESGVGKELVARDIHERGVRNSKPFIAVNCAALSENLLESELFGHERGAFTGAIAEKKGRFELAHTGTLFLDEIGEISPAVQLRLLRVLQEKEFERVGGTKSIRVDVRVVCATNKDPKQLVSEGKFREDLLYRINVIHINVPPLRERIEDIGELVAHFLDLLGVELHREVTVPAEIMALLRGYRWPGNIRELENVIERGMVLCPGNVMRVEDLPPEIRELRRDRVPQDEPPARKTAPEQVQEMERDLILAALVECRWNQSKAARKLGMGRTSLQYKMKKYGLRPE
ncbi:MAG: sigma-54 dependent transcriptional regulator [Planctomycetes bacterium]|nr:sigma-54 dependent transcriptional regulator [Planctomycetota bacterium]